jgi:glucose/arabinose dehydrogenase
VETKAISFIKDIFNQRKIVGLCDRHPVGVAVSRDGALLVSEDGNGTIWRITR